MIQHSGLIPADRWTASKTWFEAPEVSTGITLVLLDHLGINFPAAFVFASRLNLFEEVYGSCESGL
jgi:hypothetical protein